jgi:rhodanese-related sulfurtransferase
MKRVFLWRHIHLLLFLAVVLGCPRVSSEGEEAGVAQVAAWLKAKEATAVDVNVEEVREEYGLLPGALLLSTSSSYEASLLPKDKGRKLVFYCLNRLCTASHVAARRAKGFGYKNVYVMSEGIKAWKEAGLPIDGLPST